MLSLSKLSNKILKILFITSAVQLAIFPQAIFASDIVKGREIYNQHCIMCHGQTGKSTMAGAANFRRGEGLFKSDFQLLERIKNGEKACPAYLGILKEQQIFNVIAYIRTLFK